MEPEDQARFAVAAVFETGAQIISRAPRRRPKPRIELVFRGDFDPYLMTQGILHGGSPVAGRWFRVGVLNRTSESISGVEVGLTHIDPPIYPPLPVTLHRKGDDPPPTGRWSPIFDLPPGKEPTQFVDVVVQIPGDPELQIVQINKQIVTKMPSQPCRLTLTVGSPSDPATDTDFVVSFREGVLQFAKAPRPRSWWSGLAWWR
jgi:hypothetical protein